LLRKSEKKAIDREEYTSNGKGVTAKMVEYEHTRRPDTGPRFTENDLPCLRWIGEQGGAQFVHVQRNLARLSPNPEKLAVPELLSVQRTRKKKDKWKREGLIEYKTFLVNERGWLWLTRRGLEYVGLADLRYYEPKLESLRHLYFVNQARLYVERQRPDGTWKSERIIRYEQPALPAGKKVPHIPDGLLMNANGEIIAAIEVELTSKKRERVLEILKGLSSLYRRTWYFVAQPAWTVIEVALLQLPEQQRRSIQILSVEQKLM
jgi:hypothetical protein